MKVGANEQNKRSLSEIMEGFHLVHHNFMRMINSYNGIGEVDITKEQMKQFPVDNWVEISDGVWSKRKKDLPDGTLVFDVIMEEGSELGLHRHSDCTETCDIIEGKMADLQTNLSYGAGNQVIYKPNQIHIPVALMETKMMVYFQ